MTYKNDNRARQQRRTPSQNQQRAPQQQGSGQNHWQRNYERYQALAAASDSDPVSRENYWQHAEHFYRMMHAAQPAD
jgi:hypothetical protein